MDGLTAGEILLFVPLRDDTWREGTYGVLDMAD